MSIADNAVGNYTVKNVLTLQNTETIGYAVDQMIKNRFRRFPVLNESSKLVGIVTATDIVRELYEKGSVEIFKEKINSVISREVISLPASDTLSSA
ncbi:MAG: CBS domain-containing protein, partial [Candidatus Kariarchaeaceae archaeon]